MNKRTPSDLGSAFLHQHHEMRDEDADAGGQRRRARVVDQRPIDRYRQRKQLSDRLWQAAEQLSRSFTAAGLEPAVCMRWSEYLDAGLPLYYDVEHKTDGYTKFWEAMESAGPASYGVLWAVVCMQESAQSYATRRGLEGRTGIALLIQALEPVAHHYKV